MSKLSWQTIPTELLHQILDCLENSSDALQATLVCQNWRHPAYSRLYAAISFKSANQVAQLAKTLKESNYGPGSLIKELDFGDLCDTAYNKKRLLKMICLCPQLTCLNVNERKIMDTFYPDLLDLFNQGHLQHIRTIPSFWFHQAEALQDLYSCTALAMKASLTHLQVVEPTTITAYRPDIRQPSKKCLEVGHINLLEHLTSFPRLQSIDVDYTATTFLCQQDPFIDTCATHTSKVHFKLSNSHLFKKSRLPQVPQLDLAKIKQQPHVKELLIYGEVITTTDLEYIMNKFTGLRKVSVGGGYLHEDTDIGWLASKGMLSKEVFARFLQFLLSTGSFEASNLTTSLEVEELLETVAKHRQVKTLKLSYCYDDYAEGLHFSLINKKKEIDHSFQHFEDRTDGACEMTLNVLHDSYVAFFEKTLQQFAGDSVDQVLLEQVVDEPLDEGGDLGRSFSYVLDHYTGIKDIVLGGVKLESCNANVTTRHLNDLKFSCCTIFPGILPKLSNSLEYVKYMLLEEDSMKIVGADEAHISIEMPRTTFGEIALPDLYRSTDDQDLLLIKIHTSVTNTTHYLLSYKELNIFASSQVFENASINFGTDAITFVSIECVDLERFNIGSVSFDIRSRKSKLL